MKKFLVLSAAALAFVTAPALADHHEKGEHMKKHGEKMFEKHDVNNDGVVSKEEFMNHAEEKFQKMDASGDGSVTKEEAEAAWKEMKKKWKEKREKMGDAPVAPEAE